MRVVLAVLLLAACTGDDGGGGGGSELRLDLFDEGPLTLTGTVTFPAATAGGVHATVAATDASFATPDGDLEFFNSFQNQTITGGLTSAPFRITGATAGDKLAIAVIIDQNNDLKIPDGGDFAGWYAGTAADPIGHEEAPTVITVTADMDGLDFAIGAVTCKAAIGESCTVDSDCRGTSCKDGNGAGTHVSTGSCQGTCQLVACDPGETASEGSCLGGFAR